MSRLLTNAGTAIRKPSVAQPPDAREDRRVDGHRVGDLDDEAVRAAGDGQVADQIGARAADEQQPAVGDVLEVRAAERRAEDVGGGPLVLVGAPRDGRRGVLVRRAERQLVGERAAVLRRRCPAGRPGRARARSAAPTPAAGRVGIASSTAAARYASRPSASSGVMASMTSQVRRCEPPPCGWNYGPVVSTPVHGPDESRTFTRSGADRAVTGDVTPVTRHHGHHPGSPEPPTKEHEPCPDRSSPRSSSLLFSALWRCRPVPPSPTARGRARTPAAPAAAAGPSTEMPRGAQQGHRHAASAGVVHPGHVTHTMTAHDHDC